MSGKEIDFEGLSINAQDFVITVASSAIEGVDYTKENIEELMEEIGILDDNERSVIIGKLTGLKVLREEKAK